MPKGTWHVETGILRARQWGYALERHDGGMWQLDVPGSARRYLGMRVTVEGRRSGFDMLDVHRIWPVDRPIESPWRRWPTLIRRFGLS